MRMRVPQIRSNAQLADLLHLLDRVSQNEDQLDEVSSAIVLHPRATTAVFARLLELGVDPNTIATSGRAPVAVLRQLARSKRRDVREHAQLNLATRQLRSASHEQFRRLLRRHVSDSGLDLGMRQAIGSNSRAPVDVLGELAMGSDGFARAAAVRELMRRAQHSRRARSEPSVKTRRGRKA